jgi:hypothetical protein
LRCDFVIILIDFLLDFSYGDWRSQVLSLGSQTPLKFKKNLETILKKGKESSEKRVGLQSSETLVKKRKETSELSLKKFMGPHRVKILATPLHTVGKLSDNE